MNKTDKERRNILVIAAIIVVAFVAACWSLGAAQPLHGHEIKPLVEQPSAEWQLSREGRGDGAGTRKIYTVK